MEPWELDEPADESADAPWENDKPAPEEKPPKMTRTEMAMNLIFGMPDAGTTIVSGMAGMAAGGVTGLASLPWGVDRAVKNAQSVQSAMQWEPKTKYGADVVEGVGKVMHGAEEAAQMAVGGAAGLMEAGRLQSLDAGANLVREVDEKGIRQTLGDDVFEKTGSPALATAGYIGPDAAIMAPALRGLGRTPKAEPPAPKAAAQADYQQVADTIKQGKPPKVAEVVDPNPQMVAAFDELQVPHTPGAVSESAVFRAEQSALKSRPGSELTAVDEATQKGLMARADELIEGFGGTLDRSLLNDNIKSTYESTVRILEKEGDKAWISLNKKLDQKVPVNVNPLADHLRQMAEDLGGGDVVKGLELLPKTEARLWRLITKKHVDAEGGVTFEVSEPSYALIDQTRKELGQGMNQQGPFRDADAANLDYLYGKVSEAQQGSAKAQGLGKEYSEANQLIIKRKEVEKAAVAALGRDMGRGSLSIIDQAARDLVAGDTSKFSKLMEALPEGHRPEVALAIVQDIFIPGRAQSSHLQAGFVERWQKLNKNTRAKDALFEHLPAEARRRFDLIGRAAKGFYRSIAKDNHSNTARDVIASMDEGGMFGKIFRGAGTVAAAEGITTSAGLPGMGTVVAGAKWLLSKKGPASNTADSLLASPQMQQAVRDYAAGKAEAANTITETRVFKRWYDNAGLSKADKAAITTYGFMQWLTTEDEK